MPTPDLSETGCFLLFDGINNKTVQPVIEGILKVNSGMIEVPEIKLYINSPGGSVWAAFSLIDMMRSCRVPVSTIGLGGIASSGFLIFMAGTKGKRILTPNTSILSHQTSSFLGGKEHDLSGYMDKEMELVKERIYKLYKQCGKTTDKIIKEYLLAPTDCWLSAEETLKYGFCDHIKQNPTPMDKKASDKKPTLKKTK